MRYVCMHKVGPTSEAGLPPSPELVSGMGQLIGETAKTGMFLAGGGLKPSRDRLRLTFAQGRCTVTPGPLVGGNELPASFATIKVKTRDEGIEWANRYDRDKPRVPYTAVVAFGRRLEPWLVSAERTK